MELRHYLFLAVLATVVPSLSYLILPDTVANIYASIMHPLVLFLGFVFALRVASTYQRELKKSFLFLSLFLILYMLSNIPALWELLYSLLGQTAAFLALFLQVSHYAILITSCVYTLRVIEAKRMNRYGWIFLGVTFSLCVGFVVYEVPLIMSPISISPIVAISRMLMVVCDMSIVLLLLPVVFLYFQHLRSEAQESITFTLTMGGLILGLASTYIVRLVTGTTLDIITVEYFQQGSILDVIYTFGYLVVATGLYVHRNYVEWGLKTIEKALG